MKNLPYFKWYPADAEMDESFRAMTDAEVGFYLRLLDSAWINGGIPATTAEIARTFGRTKTVVDRYWRRLGSRFIPHPTEPNRLVNPRQEEERLSAITKSERATESIRSRWDKKYERNRGEVLRASDSDSDSVSGFPEGGAGGNQPTAGIAEGLAAFEKFWVGDRGLPWPEDTWQEYGHRVTDSQRLHALITNGPGHADSKRYRDGFHDSKRFLRDACWLKPVGAAQRPSAGNSVMEEARRLMEARHARREVAKNA